MEWHLNCVAWITQYVPRLSRIPEADHGLGTKILTRNYKNDTKLKRRPAKILNLILSKA
jgi:hypothetical protein